MDASKELRVLHTGFFRSAPRGVVKQLDWETTSAETIGSHWDTEFWFAQAPPAGTGVRRLPVRSRLLCEIWFARWLWQQHGKYDVVLLRYPAAAPGVAVSARFSKNVVLQHHSQEWTEILTSTRRLRKYAKLFIEGLARLLWRKAVLAIVGVTPEIAKDNAWRSVSGQHRAYPNGIVCPTKGQESDSRDPETVHLLFMAAEFQLWHGLDVLLDHARDTQCRRVTVHIVGRVPPKYNEMMRRKAKKNGQVRCHGFLTGSELGRMISRCDMAIDSLALERLGMTEGSTLKTREYLALGIPVVSRHVDPAFPADFPFYQYSQDVDFDKWYDLAMDGKKVRRSEVVDAARPYIDKRVLMEDLTRWLLHVSSEHWER